MGTEVFGIGASQNKDNVGETIVIDGMDLSKCRVLSDEHGDSEGNIPFFRIIGSITKAIPIHSEDECQDAYQLKCWKHSGVPFIYTEAEMADETGHPDAISAAALLKFCHSQPSVPLKIGLSVEGGIIERSPDKKTLMKTVASGFAVTIKPCNPVCSLWLKHDLQKSDKNITPPARYFEALNKSQSKHSFIENKEAILQHHIERIRKSLADYQGGFTSVKCYNCGSGQRFFKSGDVPNGCQKCGENFSMADIWKALNR